MHERRQLVRRELGRREDPQRARVRRAHEQFLAPVAEHVGDRESSPLDLHDGLIGILEQPLLDEHFLLRVVVPPDGQR